MKYTIKGYDIGRYDCDTLIIDNEEKVEFQICVAKGIVANDLIGREVEIEDIFNGVVSKL